jgi:glycosyltransferase involved in cell wall biosynthesis
MKVLFVHNAYPSQFIHLANALAREVEVAAIGSSTGAFQSESIQFLRYNVPDKNLSAAHPFARRFEAECRRAEQVIYAASALKASGFNPDITVVHPGWGESLPVRDLFPYTKLVVYCEYFYKANGADFGFDLEFSPTSVDSHVRVHLYNAASLLAMVQADKLFSPTVWQRSLFPQPFQEMIEVLHEGIDTEVAKPDARAEVALASGRLTASQEVITYVARNLEPYRGYHVFMRALPAVLRERPKAHVLIVGGSGVSYGASTPAGQSWKDVFMGEVADNLDLDRVHFAGVLSYNEYLKVLQISSVHVYLTYPFILSWSMLEAMSAACLVIGSDTPPVAEVIQHGANGLLTPFLEPEALAECIVGCLAKPENFRHLRTAARQTVLEKYSLQHCLPQMLKYILA